MIEARRRSQEPEFRSQNGLEVASLRRFDKIDRAEGEVLILDSEFWILDSRN